MKLLKEYIKSLIKEGSIQPHHIRGAKEWLKELDPESFQEFQGYSPEEYQAEVEQMGDQEIVNAIQKNWDGKAKDFFAGKSHDYFEPMIDEDPDEEKRVKDEMSVVGSIGGYSLPIGMSPKNRRTRMEKPWKAAARAFGGAKKSKKKNPYGL